MFKLMKWTLIGAVGTVLLASLFLGPDVFSYATSSFRNMQCRVKSAVPLEFELQRAKDLMGNFLPELRQNVVLVAQEEVAVDELEKEIARQRHHVEVSRRCIANLREEVTMHPVTYGQHRARKQKIDELQARLERVKLAEQLLQGKDKVLSVRKKALAQAIHALKDAQLRKVELEAQIEHLEHEIRLMKLQKDAPRVNVDQSSIVKAERLVKEVRKRVEVARRVLSSGFELEGEPAEEITEDELLCKVDAYLKSDSELVESEVAGQ